MSYLLMYSHNSDAAAIIASSTIQAISGTYRPWVFLALLAALECCVTKPQSKTKIKLPVYVDLQ